MIKKTWVIYLECSFPLNNFETISNEVERDWYGVRITDNKWRLDMTIGTLKKERDEDSLIKIKKQLTKYSYGDLQ